MGCSAAPTTPVARWTATACIWLWPQMSLSVLLAARLPPWGWARSATTVAAGQRALVSSLGWYRGVFLEPPAPSVGMRAAASRVGRRGEPPQGRKLHDRGHIHGHRTRRRHSVVAGVGGLLRPPRRRAVARARTPRLSRHITIGIVLVDTTSQSLKIAIKRATKGSLARPRRGLPC